jgi:adenine phosphoribosyltransferase
MDVTELRSKIRDIRNFPTEGILFKDITTLLKDGPAWAVVDDLLATGGTMAATLRLVERLGGKVVGAAFLIELGFLKGRDRLRGYPIEALIRYD